MRGHISEPLIYLVKIICISVILLFPTPAMSTFDLDEDQLNVNVRLEARWENLGESTNIVETGFATLNISGTIERFKQENEYLEYRGKSLTATSNWESRFYSNVEDERCTDCCPTGSLLYEERGSRSIPVKQTDFLLKVFLGEFGNKIAQREGCTTPVEGVYEFRYSGVPFDTVRILHQKGCFPAPDPEYFKMQGRQNLGFFAAKTIDTSGMWGSYTWNTNTLPFMPYSLDPAVWDYCGNVRFSSSFVEMPGENIKIRVSWRFGKVKPILQIWREGKDITDETEEVLVGEKIELKAVVLPETATIQRGEWEKIPGDPIEDFVVGGERGYIDKLEEAELKKPEVKFHWWDGKDNLTVKYSAVVDGKKLEAKANFVVKEPKIKLKSEVPDGDFTIGEVTYREDKEEIVTRDELIYDPPSENYTIKFTHDPLPNEFPGETQYVQLVHTDARNEKHKEALNPCLELNKKGLDKKYPYSPGPEATDAPGVPVTYMDLTIEVNHHYEMYLMFKPEGEGSIFVPLRVMDWDWIGIAKRKSILDLFDLRGSGVSKDPEDREAEKYPTWDMILKEEIEWTPCPQRQDAQDRTRTLSASYH